MITNFKQFSAEKLAFFLETHSYESTFVQFSNVLGQKRLFFGENIFTIITSVPALMPITANFLPGANSLLTSY
jgi:hypothetical protein